MSHEYFAFQWHITDECDQRCKHCYIFAEGHPALVTMNRVRIEHVFFNALEFCQTFDRLPYFYITGGDPILHPHFWFLLLLMKEHGRFELPAHTPADKTTSASGTSYAGTVSDSSNSGVGYNFDKLIIYGGCNCGNCHITILPTGDIYACRRVANSRIGNACDERLADVWTGKKMEAYRDYGKFSKCSRCELLPYCRGCPAVASGSCGGDFYAADPQCWKEVAG
ncbi:SPASM domain-containing protein [Treponema sp. Marseille-Q4130]|uniref:SPASM domain-containing protein n=1 Tax=Treponema sp. Marseille-Q4130 TaxID=2766702 RepID=UPI0016522811|nr:SPASM domain-containing protein [Treponema sp. Marseille-Q4130]MBC6721083.1 SPASM domain-containing protein [Treponema sp. Marseille-Q4130]